MKAYKVGLGPVELRTGDIVSIGNLIFKVLSTTPTSVTLSRKGSSPITTSIKNIKFIRRNTS